MGLWGTSGLRIATRLCSVLSACPEKLKTLAESLGENAHIETPAEAANFADIVVLAVHWTNAFEALKSAGSLDGKILIDCTNPLKPDYSGLTVAYDTSDAEEVAKLVSGAKVVKAFNSTFADIMNSESRMFDSLNIADSFYCGNDISAKKVVTELIRETGLEPEDVRVLSSARYLEPLAMLMITLGFGMGMGSNVALKLLKR